MPSRQTVEEGETVHGRDGEHVGTTTGSTHACQLEGCPGRRIAVRWSDGHMTYPCERGMERDDGEWQIK
jgi:hypothetical protein